MPFDPTKPANNSPINSAELRTQFTSLKAQIDTKTSSTDVSNQILAEASGNCDHIPQLGMVISNPPTQAQVQALVYKIDELLDALHRA